MSADRSQPDAPATESSRSQQSKKSVSLGTTAGIAVLFLVLRLLAVSKWDWATVGAIADTFSFSEAPAIFLGTLLGAPVLTGVLLAVLLPLSIVRLVWPVSAGGQPITITGMLFPVALLASTAAWVASFHTIWVIAVSAGVALVLVAARLVTRKGALPVLECVDAGGELAGVE